MNVDRAAKPEAAFLPGWKACAGPATEVCRLPTLSSLSPVGLSAGISGHPRPFSRMIFGWACGAELRAGVERNPQRSLQPFLQVWGNVPSFLFQVRTRGSIKRRPPSRRFRRSQSDCGELGDFRAPESSQENGAQEENGDEVFPSQSKAPGSPPASEGAVGREGSTPGSHEKPPLRRTTSRTEKQEQKGQAAEEDPQPDKPAQEAQEKALEPASASSAEAKSGCGSPTEASTAGEQTEEPPQGKAEMETTGPGEEEPGQKSQDKKPLQEEGAGEQETPQAPPGGAEAGLTPKEGQGKEKQDEVPILEPGCNPRTGQAQAETSSEVPETEGDTSVEDTKM